MKCRQHGTTGQNRSRGNWTVAQICRRNGSRPNGMLPFYCILRSLREYLKSNRELWKVKMHTKYSILKTIFIKMQVQRSNCLNAICLQAWISLRDRCMTSQRCSWKRQEMKKNEIILLLFLK